MQHDERMNVELLHQRFTHWPWGLPTCLCRVVLGLVP